MIQISPHTDFQCTWLISRVKCIFSTILHRFTWICAIFTHSCVGAQERTPLPQTNYLTPDTVLNWANLVPPSSSQMRDCVCRCCPHGGLWLHADCAAARVDAWWMSDCALAGFPPFSSLRPKLEYSHLFQLSVCHLNFKLAIIPAGAFIWQLSYGKVQTFWQQSQHINYLWNNQAASRRKMQ